MTPNPPTPVRFLAALAVLPGADLELIQQMAGGTPWASPSDRAGSMPEAASALPGLEARGLLFRRHDLWVVPDAIRHTLVDALSDADRATALGLLHRRFAGNLEPYRRALGASALAAAIDALEVALAPSDANHVPVPPIDAEYPRPLFDELLRRYLGPMPTEDSGVLTNFRENAATIVVARTEDAGAHELRLRLDVVGLSHDGPTAISFLAEVKASRRHHPDNETAVAAILRARGVYSRQHHLRRLTVVHALGTHLVANANLILVGGPNTELYTRAIFGYEPRPERGLVATDAGLDLPLRWVNDLAQVDEGRVVKRIRSGEVVERPNWAIVGDPGRRYEPEVDDRGFLSSDYLLLTHMPNVFAEDTAPGRFWITSIGGTHGVGTRALTVLLRDDAALGHLARAVRGSVAFQAVFRIGRVTHGTDLSEAGAVEFVEAVSLSARDGRLTYGMGPILLPSSIDDSAP